MLLRQSLLLALPAAISLAAAPPDTIQLKDKAAVSGKILAEKRDQVALDIGYTVLVIPRNQITKISRSGFAEARAETNVAPPEAAPPATQSGATGLANLYTTNSKPGITRTVNELVNLLGESVVQVRTPASLGSGFLINDEGYLITNFHVIEGESQLSVEVYHQRSGQLDRKTYKQVRIVAINKFADLALLKIDDRDAPKFKFVDLANTDSVAVGERVFAIGSPLGLERTVTEGILSTKTRPMAGELYLQTTAQINPGNSGGPLFNLRGEVVGVTNMKITFGEGLGFAIPAEAVRFFLDHRDAYAYANDNPGSAYRYLEPPARTRAVANSKE
jgi:serine protease Do